MQNKDVLLQWNLPGQYVTAFVFPSVTSAPEGSGPSLDCNTQNGPSSSTTDPHNAHYSSDDDDSDTEDDALQKEISRLREK